ncbi:MAG: HEAT repeat domain-containing protein, partial [Anaerolineae bacterium]|nr:HEAT repeat domain-containing protein [Anaerolineae bacterium]
GAVTLQRLTDAQMRIYLADLPDLQAAIDADEGLREMARTPLLLSYLAFGFRDRPDAVKELHDLREGALRDAIFNAYMDKRYDREVKRLAKQGNTPPFTLEFIRETLGRLAMENAGGMFRRGSFQHSIHSDNVLHRLDFALILPEEQITPFITFCRDLHYLQQSSEGLGFIHLRLRDTLVYDYSLPRLRQHDLYTETYEPNPATALGAIRDGRAFDALLGLIQNAAIDSMLRACAANGLIRLGDTRAVEPLISALADANVGVRLGAAFVLGSLGDARAVQPLIRALADADEDVRRIAADALGQLGDARAVEPLIRALADADEDVRRRAADALGMIGTPAVEPLITALADEDVYVCRSAADALRMIGTPAVEPLIAVLGDADEDVCLSAADALRMIGTPAVAPLITALADAAWHVRSRAAYALGWIGDACAVEPLITALADEDVYVRRRAAYALGQLGDARAVEPLIRALADADAYIRSSASDALKQIGDARAVEPLIRTLADADEVARIHAAAALGRLGDARAIEPLITTLADAAWHVRSSSAAALGQIGDARAVEPLRRALDDRTEVGFGWRVWNVAHAALNRIGTPEALAAVQAWRERERKRHGG